MTARSLQAALSEIDDWNVSHAAAVVVGADGVEAAWGDVRRQFGLASVTKVLVALAVLVAIEEETLGRDQPAGPSGSTVSHLLAHASGLGPDGAVLAPPGTRRIYSNAGFEELGRTLAEASGMTAAEYLSAAVLVPLKMGDTRLEGSVAHGAVASAADLGRLATELLAPHLITPATLTMATRSTFPRLAGVLPGFGHQDPNPWGLGFEIRGHKRPHWTGTRNSPDTFGHFGRVGTFLWVDPSAALSLVVLTDEPFGPWAAALWPLLADHVLATRSSGRVRKIGRPTGQE